MKKCAWLLLCLLLTASLPALARTWRDTQGNTLEGEFDRVVKGRVLINVGDRTVQVPFGHLVTEDQDYVREKLKAHGLESQVPAKKKTSDSDATSKSPATDSAAEEPIKLGPVRTWTDVLGRSVEARFIGVENGRVRLQFKGRNTSFPFEKFGLADQQYVRGEMTARGEADKVPAETPANAQPAAAPQIAQAGPPAMPRGRRMTGPRMMPAMPHLPQFTRPAFTPPAQRNRRPSNRRPSSPHSEARRRSRRPIRHPPGRSSSRRPCRLSRQACRPVSRSW